MKNLDFGFNRIFFFFKPVDYDYYCYRFFLKNRDCKSIAAIDYPALVFALIGL